MWRENISGPIYPSYFKFSWLSSSILFDFFAYPTPPISILHFFPSKENPEIQLAGDVDGPQWCVHDCNVDATYSLVNIQASR